MIGISHRSLTGGPGLAAAIEMAAAVGFAAVEYVRPEGEGGSPRPSREWYRQRRIEVWAAADTVPPGAPSLAELPTGRGAAARARVLGLRQAATSLGCQQLVIRAAPVAAGPVLPGDLPLMAASRTRELESFCRNVHALLPALGSHRLAILPVADAAAVPSASELSLVLDDLKDPRLGYWFATDTAAWLASAGADPQQWLDCDRARFAGSYLADHVGERGGQLPGTGCVDWASVASELSHRPAILNLSGCATREELLTVQRFVAGLGL